MNVAERRILALKKELKKINNTHVDVGDMEYRIEYRGGIAEYIAIFGRKKDENRKAGLPYRFIDGFEAYTMVSKDQALEKAKSIIQKL